MQIDGVWSDKPSWQCQKPGDTPSSAHSEPSLDASSLSGGLSNLGGSSNLGDGGGGASSQSKPAASSSSSQSATSTTTPQMGSMSIGSDTNPEMYANASASLGGCGGLAVPAGWDGVASTSVRLFLIWEILQWKADIAISITDTWAPRAIVGKMISVKHHGKRYVRSNYSFALLALSPSLCYMLRCEFYRSYIHLPSDDPRSCHMCSLVELAY